MPADAYVMDADMKKVADAIRAKGETTEQLSFPDGMVNAIDGLSTGGINLKEIKMTRIMCKASFSTRPSNTTGFDVNSNKYITLDDEYTRVTENLEGEIFKGNVYISQLNRMKYKTKNVKPTIDVPYKTYAYIVSVKIDKLVYDFELSILPENKLTQCRFLQKVGRSYMTSNGRPKCEYYWIGKRDNKLYFIKNKNDQPIKSEEGAIVNNINLPLEGPIDGNFKELIPYIRDWTSDYDIICEITPY